MGIGTEAGLIVLLVLANGVFAMSEIAIVSARRARLQKLAERGDRGAASAISLAEQPTLFLSTVQVGITLVSTLAGAFGGATLSEELAVVLATWPVVGPHSEAVAFGLVVAAISYLSLILGELVPKRIALNGPEAIARVAAPPMRFLSRVMAPVVAFLSFSTNIVLKLLPFKQDSQPAVTEDEIRTMIALGAKSGVFHEEERQMVDSVFRLGDRRAIDLMTPRTKVVWLDVDEPVSEATKVALASPYSRFPVAKGSLDRVVGFLEARDLLALQDQSSTLAAHVRQPLFVPEGFPGLRLIDLFRASRSPMAVVVGEHGEARGIVTSTDLLEAIVGDLPQAQEDFEPRVVRRADGSLLVDGLVTMNDVKELLSMDDLGEAEASYNTLGGFVMFGIGRVPTAGDNFEYGKFRFEVVDMDGRRVDRVLISATSK